MCIPLASKALKKNVKKVNKNTPFWNTKVVYAEKEGV
jgi:hypothetical protein